MNTTNTNTPASRIPLPGPMAEAINELWSMMGHIELAEVPGHLRLICTDPGGLPPELDLCILLHNLEGLASCIETQLAADADEEATAWADKVANMSAGHATAWAIDSLTPSGTRYVAVECPAPGSVWYLFGNRDLKVTVVDASAGGVTYRDNRLATLNREQRRQLSDNDRADKTQPLFQFLACATPIRNTTEGTTTE